MNIVAKKQTLPGFGQTLVVVKVVLVRSVALTRTVELQMNVVFLTNALIAIVRDVLVTQIALPDTTVVRKDIGTSLVSAVHTVLENLVPRARTVELQMNAVFLTNALIAVVRDVLVTQIALPDITVVRKDIGTSLVSAVHTVLENLVPRAMTVVDRMKFVTGMQSDMNLDACR